MTLARQAAAAAQTKRRRVQIDEVNVAQNVVTGKDQYGLTFQITYGPWFDHGTISVPKQGENWIVEQYRQEWRLKYKVEDLTDIVGSLQPGDKYLNAGTFWMNGNANLTNGYLTLNDPTDAQHAATKNYVDSQGANAVESVFGRTGIVTAQTGDYTVSQVTGAAPLSSPALTGTPTTTTPALGDDSTTIPTTHWVKQQGFITSAPVSSVFSRTGAITAQSGDYTVSQITGAAPLASPTFTGTPAAPTPATADNSTKIATTAFVKAQGYVTSTTSPVTSVFTRTGAVTAQTGDYTVSQITGAAPLASPTFTGTPAAPTAAADTNTTQVATTAFVLGQAGSATPLVDGTAAVGTSTRYARQDHVHPVGSGTKITTSAFSGGPPASPSDGDIWIASGVDSNGTRWQFQYNAGSSSAYKWEFIGGIPMVKIASGGDFPVSGTWGVTSCGTWTITRAGEYFLSGYLWGTTNASGGGTLYALGYWYNGAFGGQLTGISQGGASLQFQVNYDKYPMSLNASDTIGLAFYSNSAYSAPVNNGSMSLIPRRVS